MTLNAADLTLDCGLADLSRVAVMQFPRAVTVKNVEP
jgi:hypothetical protein